MATSGLGRKGIAGPPICEGGRGFFFPVSDGEQYLSSPLRAIIYLCAMAYLFLAVNVVSDRFTGSILRITGRRVRFWDRRLARFATKQRWNQTLANITLLGLASSMPEILLSIGEIVVHDFHSGRIGPSTIVGSAAFNLFVIIAVCIYVVPSPQTRRIKKSGVFAVTAVFSILCYSWMLCIVKWSSPDVIEIWEGVLTLAFFPIFLILSYLVDVGWSPMTGFAEVDEGDAIEIKAANINDGDADLVGKADDEDAEAAFVSEQAAAQASSSTTVVMFHQDTLDLDPTSEEQTIPVTITMKPQPGIIPGKVSCRYRTERLCAVPEFDYNEQAGELHFGIDCLEAEITLTILPGRIYRTQGQFQVILDFLEGNATFNAADDGGRESACLTVTISPMKIGDEPLKIGDQGEDGGETVEATETVQPTFALKLVRMLDSAVGIDSIRLGGRVWARTIRENVAGSFATLNEQGEPRTPLHWASTFVTLPWRGAFAFIVPPPEFGGGWPCFLVSIMVFVLLVASLLDFTELFSCVAGIQDSVTGLTLVSIGTSLPDLFVSMTAARQNEWADASIVNVTGSNSVNVLLGIGFPWTVAAIFWSMQTGPELEEWRLYYPAIAERYPNGAFAVDGGDLGFNVGVFTVGACLCFVVLRLRRFKYGGELGGPAGSKLFTAGFLVFCWLFYVLLCVWKAVFDFTDFGTQASTALTPENIITAFAIIIMTAFIGMMAADAWSGDWWRYSM